MERQIGWSRVEGISIRPGLGIILALAMTILGLGPTAAVSGDPFADLRAERLPQPQPVSTLSLPAVTGFTVKVPDAYRGKVVLLGFFSTT